MTGKLKFTAGIPPLILIGAIIVLFPIFTYMTVDRINRHRAQSIHLLFEKSTALIRAVEAGARTGMMNMGWRRTNIEDLLEQTASLPDISFIFIIDKNGKIIAHSNKEKIREFYNANLDLKKILDSSKAFWRVNQDNQSDRIFEVYKKFTPLRLHGKGKFSNNMFIHQRMQRHCIKAGLDYDNTIIFIGLDMKPIDQADKDDLHHSVMMGIILLLIGLTGFMLIFLVQRYGAARSSLSRIKVFSDNLVENMPIGLIAMDNTDKIISINPAAKKILGIPWQDKSYMNAGYTLPQELIKLVRSVYMQDKLIEQEIQIKNQKGKSTNLDIVANPLKAERGEALGILLILRDLTEINQLKDEIETNKRLATIGRLAGGVAHEIRNPLSSLKGYATFFKEIFEKESDNYNIADIMTKEVDRLNKVVSELVEFSKPLHVSGKLLKIRELIKESIEIIRHNAETNNINIVLNLDNNPGEIIADKDRLKQVLLNLYLNAVQAMENSGGTLTIELFCDGASSDITIKISDTGPGMDKHTIANIFEPYFTTKLSGTGLGLAIAYNIIKAHKGNLKVKSKPGQGTIFTIILPDTGIYSDE